MPSPCILIVEDDANLRKTLHDILALKGYAPVSAATGQAALAAAQSQAPAAAVIDLKLADLSGLEVLRQLKALSPTIECLMVTGYASQASAIEAVNLGAYSYVQKPYDMEQLLTILRRALERREAAEALRASEARYRMLIENVGEGLGFVNADERFLFANPAAEGLFGVSPGGLRGLSLQAFTTPEQFAAITAQTRERQHGVKSVYEIEISRPDGEKRSLLITAVPQFSETGAFSGTFGVFRDITENKRAEVALRVSEQMARQTAEQLRVVNQIGVTITAGLDRERVMQTIYEQCQQIGPADTFYIALYDDVTAMLSFPFYRKDGERRALAARNVKESPGLAGHVIETHRTLYVSDDANLPAGITPVRQPGPPTRSVVSVPLVLRDRVVGIFSMQSHAPNAYSPEQVHTLELLATQVAIAIQNSQLYELAQQELIERKRAEEALRDERALLTERVEERTAELSLANAALNRAGRLKDEFLANMSHELRTPLTGILGLSETLQMGVYGTVSDKQLQALRAIQDSGQHLLELINDILDLSKVEAGKLELNIERTVVADVCLASVQFVQQTALRKNLRLSTKLDAQVIAIRADARRLKQMLVNLLSNAVKFTPEGGEVGVTVEGDPAQQAVRFTVWDTGIGVAAQDQERLFKPFVQIDSRLAREYAGTGLGLSLVLRMAELHGGSVSVESELARGSRFTISLPWYEIDQAPGASAPLGLRQAVTVEDADIAAEHMSRYLTELGIRNTVHSCGTGVIEKVLEVRPDVILLDIMLPDISGWEVLQLLKADGRTSAIPVIIVSVVDERDRGAALGATGYLVKPVALSDLQMALKQCAGHPAPQPTESALVVMAADRPLILVADDNETVIMTLTGYLRTQAYRLLTAGNGSEALECARQNRPDLILMDIQMPGMDGTEAIQRLRAEPDAKLAATPIIALTALAMPGDRERCLAAGATDYLTKPVNLPRLIETMEGLLKRS